MIEDKIYLILENCDFMTISHAYLGETQCTPQLLDPYFGKFEGLLINGPKEIVWPDGISLGESPLDPFGHSQDPHRLMVAGLIRVKYNTMGLKGEFAEHVMLVAIDQNPAKKNACPRINTRT